MVPPTNMTRPTAATHDTQDTPLRAVLVGVALPEVTDAEFQSSLAELQRLVTTLGHPVLGRVTQRRSKLAPGMVLGQGKLKLLADYTGGTGVVPSGAIVRKRRIDAKDDETPDTDIEATDDDFDVEASAEDADPGIDEDGDDTPLPEAFAPGERASLVVVDHELSPTQLKNLEQATGVTVLDRTAVILEIFHRHARSREARLQVEIARLGYLSPRLRGGAGGGDRQRGGIGGKGAGESSLELDRRKIRDRIAELRRELDAIAHEQDVRRSRRQEQLRVALVGYTNAGKSSLMRALTGSEVYVADKLFATLDTTVRPLWPESVPRVLVSDTVGFIKKLPHDLVASFRSTLDEAREASLLLHIVDASDAAWRAQHEVTRAVLAEIEAGDIDTVLVLNKCDQVDAATQEMLALEFPDAVRMSAKDPGDVRRLRDLIVAHFERSWHERTFRVPHDRGAVLGEIHRAGRVVLEEWDDDGALLTVRAPTAALSRIDTLLAPKA